LITLICEGTGFREFFLRSQRDFLRSDEDSEEPPGCASKSSIPPQKINQNDSTNLTLSIVCIHLTEAVALSPTEPLSLGDESERRDGDRIRRRRRWQYGNNGIMSRKLCGPVMTWKRYSGVVEPVFYSFPEEAGSHPSPIIQIWIGPGNLCRQQGTLATRAEKQKQFGQPVLTSPEFMRVNLANDLELASQIGQVFVSFTLWNGQLWHGSNFHLLSLGRRVRSRIANSINDFKITEFTFSPCWKFGDSP
jgi:hypothetical protein